MGFENAKSAKIEGKNSPPFKDKVNF